MKITPNGEEKTKGFVSLFLYKEGSRFPSTPTSSSVLWRRAKRSIP
jgi:hypothetical protein